MVSKFSNAVDVAQFYFFPKNGSQEVNQRLISVRPKTGNGLNRLFESPKFWNEDLGTCTIVAPIGKIRGNHRRRK